MPDPRGGVLPCSRNPRSGKIACANTASVMATSTCRPRPDDLASISAARIPITCVSAPPSRSAVSIVLLRVLAHFAVVGQLAGFREGYLATQLGDAADAVGDSIGEAGALAAHFAAQGHAVASAGIVDDEPGCQDFRMALDDFRHLGGMNKHASDLGRLVGAAHPAADARIGAAAGTRPP